MKKANKREKVSERTIELVPFDASEFLDNEEVIAEYLFAASEDPSPDTFLRAVANVARTRSTGEGPS